MGAVVFPYVTPGVTRGVASGHGRVPRASPSRRGRSGVRRPADPATGGRFALQDKGNGGVPDPAERPPDAVPLWSRALSEPSLCAVPGAATVVDSPVQLEVLGEFGLRVRERAVPVRRAQQ